MELNSQKLKEIGIEAEDNQLGFNELWGILKRRKVIFISCAMIVFVIGVTIAMILPPMYRSTAWIIIEQQSIPKELVNTTVTTYADQRIQNIKHRITSTQALYDLIKQFSLYQDAMKTKTTEEVVNMMRENIEIKMQSSEVIDPKSGRAVKANIAFTLSFSYKSPEIAQMITSELANRFRTMNLETRKKKAAETTEFLSRETSRYSKLISEVEIKLADFKEKHAGELPELTKLNTQLLDRAENELKEIIRREQTLKDKKINLQSQLSLVDPHVGVLDQNGQSILSPEKRLKTLKNRYISMAASYSPDHPDLIKTKREMEALQLVVGGTSILRDLRKQLKSKKGLLSASLKRYSSDHPDVRGLERDIEQLENAIKNAQATVVRGHQKNQPDNPAYIQIQTQLKTLESDVKSLKVAKLQTQEKIKDYEAKLLRTPQVEKEYRHLLRGYDNALAKYREFKAKYEAAKVAESLEKGSQAEKFLLLDPPRLPEKPFKPNRYMIIMLSFVAAFGAGLGLIFFMESMDKSIRGYNKLVQITGVPPLGGIPIIIDQGEYLKKRNLRNKWILRISPVAIVVILVVYFLT